MIRRVVTAASGPDLHGQLALMLCEALLHVLVERRVIKRRDALEAIDSVAELVAEIDEPAGKSARARRRGMAAREAAGIIDGMRASFAVKS
jgi:hypothetical protein